MYTPICCLYLGKNSQKVHIQLVQLSLSNHSTRLPALRDALRLRSKVQTRAHAHRICHGGFSAKYACAQPNVGVSSAVFRSGVSSVQWQLEQKERYREVF